MPKRRRGAVNSSDESEEEPAAAVTPEAQFAAENGGAAPDTDSEDSADPSESIRSRNRRRRLRLGRGAAPAEGDNDSEISGADSDEKEAKFPVVLRTRTRKRQKRGEDDSYSENESPDSGSDDSSDADEEFEFSDGGFVVDSDDNVIPAHRSNSRRKPTGRPRGRPAGRTNRTRRTRRKEEDTFASDSEDDEFTASDGSIAQELKELKGETSPQRKLRNYRERPPVNYAIPPPPTIEEVARATAKEAEVAAAGKGKDPRARRLFDVRGPFGGRDVHTIFEISAKELREVVKRGTDKAVAGSIDLVGIGPGAGPVSTAATGAGERGSGSSADVDPVDVSGDVDFSMVGGLDHYIAKLKEMVSLPLLYPELYEKFGITPPRGVLFHGPPGTGKTLMARALAASHRQEKVTFYMRKGADVLSKWIGESERQLRALFEEAQKNQPSIIFFDEIDGLAPVRSAKQEQHHASIVSTLLALMDGMDNRGQVVVIGATNRPDSVDPALRRPGRFDREFYFPLPDFDARKRILEIHTSKWVPPLPAKFIEDIAHQTKGYGGADLRALATEAALLAIQRAYPQIYGSEAKLAVNPDSIEVRPQFFTLALEKIQPSTARAAGSSLAQPLPPRIQPLLRSTFAKMSHKVSAVFPRESKDSQVAALFLNDQQFQQAREVKQFQQARVHRPRLLLQGPPGNGQVYLSRAVAHMLEGVYVREISPSTIFGMSGTVQPEAAIVGAISEARQRAPACILLPQLKEWLGEPHLETLLSGLLKSLLPSEQVFVVATNESGAGLGDVVINSPLQAFFGTEVIKIELDRDPTVLREYFAPIFEFIRRTPTQCLEAKELPRDPPPELPKAPVAQPTAENANSKPSVSAGSSEGKPLGVFSEAERAELRVRSQLKLKLGVILDGFRQRYRRFRKPVVEETRLVHLFENPPKLVDVSERPPEASEEAVPNGQAATEGSREVTPGTSSSANVGNGNINTDAMEDVGQPAPTVNVGEDDEDEEPYSRTTDNMILERATGKKYYNMDLETVEDRLWNGFYCEPQQFLEDMEMIYHDAVAFGERERMHKASEMLANAQVAIDDISLDKQFIAACRELHAKDAQARLNELAQEQQSAASQNEPPKESRPDNDEVMAVDEQSPDQDVSKEVPNDVLTNAPQTEAATLPSGLTAPHVSAVAPSDQNPETIAQNNAIATKTELAEELASEVIAAEPQFSAPPVVDPAPPTKSNVTYDPDVYSSFEKSLLSVAAARSLDGLEQLYATLVDVAWQFRNEWDRTTMITTMISHI